MTDSPGTFIVLDGTEGSGKSTQARMLQERMAQSLGPGNVVLVRDPGTTRIGEQVRALLLNPDHAEMNMRGEMLLVSSTLAYQLGGDGLTAGDIVTVAGIAIRGRWPDLTILLDMPAGASMARVNRAKDRIEQRPPEYHEQVRRNYLAQAERDPRRYRVINADRDPREVHDDVLAEVTRQLLTKRTP